MRTIISLGSNLEPRTEYLRQALEKLAALPGTRLLRQSKVRQTEPVDVPAQFESLKFLNQAAIFETELEVHEFSRRMHAIEDAMGRVRNERNGPRTIDLDIIAFGETQLDESELVLPHPRAVEREFVMQPIRELWISELREKYNAYVDTFREENGKLPVMMQLKLTHTMMVVRNAELIADGENFTDEQRFVSVAAALLHDTGRYEQLKRYNTFRDCDSIDHAVFSHDIVKSNGWLDELTGFRLLGGADTMAKAILDAVLFHNRREIPEKLDSLTELAAHVVRDADKLDIFRVIEDQVKNCDWRNDPRAFWNLAIGIPPNPAVIAAIRARRPVNYQDIKSLSDFVLIQVGWMLSELHFATSRRLCSEREHLEFRRKFLREVGGGPEADAICDLVK